MYMVTVRGGFSAAHNLRGYHGNCEKLHGHNWKVEAVITAEELNKDGLAIDFREAKQLLKKVLKEIDHAYLNELPEFKEVNPTSENIAHFIYAKFNKLLKGKVCSLRSVSVWETDANCATYSE